MRLAGCLLCPLCEWRNRANFPADHPLHLGYDDKSSVKLADVILALDHDYPYIPPRTQPRPARRSIQIDVDPIKETIPVWSFPVDLPIRANSRHPGVDRRFASEMLTDADRQRSKNAGRVCIRHRRAAIRDRRRDARNNRDISPNGHLIGQVPGELYRETPECHLY